MNTSGQYRFSPAPRFASGIRPYTTVNKQFESIFKDNQDLFSRLGVDHWRSQNLRTGVEDGYPDYEAIVKYDNGQYHVYFKTPQNPNPLDEQPEMSFNDEDFSGMPDDVKKTLFTIASKLHALELQGGRLDTQA